MGNFCVCTYRDTSQILLFEIFSLIIDVIQFTNQYLWSSHLFPPLIDIFGSMFIKIFGILMNLKKKILNIKKYYYKLHIFS